MPCAQPRQDASASSSDWSANRSPQRYCVNSVSGVVRSSEASQAPPYHTSYDAVTVKSHSTPSVPWYCTVRPEVSGSTPTPHGTMIAGALCRSLTFFRSSSRGFDARKPAGTAALSPIRSSAATEEGATVELPEDAPSSPSSWSSARCERPRGSFPRAAAPSAGRGTATQRALRMSSARGAGSFPAGRAWPGTARPWPAPPSLRASAAAHGSSTSRKSPRRMSRPQSRAPALDPW